MTTTGSVSTLDGNTFVVSDTAGDIDASPTEPNGLFSWDTRYLSRWVLTLDGHRLNPLSTDDLHYFETRFFLVPGTGTVYVDATLSVIRRREVVDGFREELTILNHSATPVTLSLRLDAAADFADLFEVKDHLKKKGKYYTRIDGNLLLLGYERQTYRRETLINTAVSTHVDAHGQPTDAPAAAIDEHGITYTVHLGGHSSWTTDLHVRCSLWGWAANQRVTARTETGHTRKDMEEDLDEWIAASPTWPPCASRP
jgi:glycogen debranching enzyme